MIRHMRHRYGIILLDSTDIIFRIYEVVEKEWKLIHFHGAKLFTLTPEGEIKPADILEVIAEFMTTQYAQHIAEWKICSRHIPIPLVKDVERGVGFKVEAITPQREQELLCKGMFTELW
jgi:hypothetical protein